MSLTEYPHIAINPEIRSGKPHIKRKGIDVTTAVSVGLRTSQDLDQLRFALQERRVNVTHDDDFLILAHAGYEHAGIAYCKQEHSFNWRYYP